MSRGDDGFLDRWSRRKRAAKEPAEDAPPPGPEEGPQGTDEALPEAELLERLGLPDPDTLQMGDDFQAFLKAGVPEFLKKRALRRLWLSNPTLANLDGLIDHGEDYTDAATVPATLTTAYKVGRGFLKQVLDDPGGDSNGDEKPDGINQESITAETAPETQKDDPDGGSHENVKIAAKAPEAAEETAVRPRRMSFHHD